MKTSLVTVSALALFTCSVISAEPAADVKAAAKKLAAKPNYSWTSTPKSESGNTPGSGPTEGQTEKDGFTYVTFSIGNNDIELAFKGDKAAIKREGEWAGLEELQGDNAWIARRLKQFKAPAAEAEDLIEKVEDLKKGENGVYTGDLTESGVKELFSRLRRRETGPTPEGAKGWAKFWITDGVLSKYQYKVQGKLTVGEDKREVEINRTTTVEIKDLGSTKVKLPEEAKKKLS
ncbi:MAG TPA: hypothetical protein VKM56_04650 [Verrucomicrobiae bacterium]|nr:hypothetical protein [Verrucomicrobiae bacterium]